MECTGIRSRQALRRGAFPSSLYGATFVVSSSVLYLSLLSPAREGAKENRTPARWTYATPTLAPFRRVLTSDLGIAAYCNPKRDGSGKGLYAVPPRYNPVASGGAALSLGISIGREYYKDNALNGNEMNFMQGSRLSVSLRKPRRCVYTGSKPDGIRSCLCLNCFRS